MKHLPPNLDLDIQANKRPWMIVNPPLCLSLFEPIILTRERSNLIASSRELDGYSRSLQELQHGFKESEGLGTRLRPEAVEGRR